MGGLSTRALDSAFGHPRGLLGQLGGALMARGNAATELQLVRLAHLTGTHRVAVLGPGPGIGLRAAGEQAAHAVGVEPSALMRAQARAHCAELIREGRVALTDGVAERTGLPTESFDITLSVNSIQLWSDRAAGLDEQRRILRPGGLLLLSCHQQWLPGGRTSLITDVESAGFTDIQCWAWNPPGRTARTAIQLRAQRSAERNGHDAGGRESTLDG